MNQPHPTSPENQVEPITKTRLRIRFTKCGDLRWISHRDLARVWERLLRRAGLQLAFSQGFHPKPKISFPSALALGIEALDEVVELEVLGVVELLSIGDVLRREMPAGMELLELRALETALGKAKVLGATYRIEHRCNTAGSRGAENSLASPTDRQEMIPGTSKGQTADSPRFAAPPTVMERESVDKSPHSIENLQQRIEAIRQLPQLEIERDGKTICCETSDPYFELKIEGDYFVFALPTVAQGSVRPSELLEHVGLGSLLEDGWTLQRTAVHLLEATSPPTPT